MRKINIVPHWTNLKTPASIRADSSINDVKIAALKADGLPFQLLLAGKKIGIDVFELRRLFVCLIERMCLDFGSLLFV